MDTPELVGSYSHSPTWPYRLFDRVARHGQERERHTLSALHWSQFPHAGRQRRRPLVTNCLHTRLDLRSGRRQLRLGNYEGNPQG